MNVTLQRVLLRPRQLWVRRLNFQIHLWTGLFLAIYATLIGLTGSILVFGAELHRILDPAPWQHIDRTGPIAGATRVIDNLSRAYPHTHVVSLQTPTRLEPVFLAVLQKNVRFTVACEPHTGRILGDQPKQSSRLNWIYDLHENLLAHRTGRVLNGFGAAFLLLMMLTGLVNWWPGIKQWRRALRVDFRRRWKRINFDLHSALGFWSAGFLLVWAVSGVYFAWPSQILAAVNRVSPVVNSQPPVIKVVPDPEPAKLDFDALLQKARDADPGAVWKGIVFPYSRRSPLEILMSRSDNFERDFEDTVYFNPYTGEYLSTWRYGINKTLGDWIIWLEIPLHFGTHWGFPVKCVWALFGLSLPLLSITGLVMYWNRVLSKWVT